jgi:tetratricopeptide (TPR) repeat protein
VAATYKAFISYSHTDSQWAKWLQSSLERYRIPDRLLRSSPGARELPRRLYPIFRDSSELASSPNLSDALTSALRNSENLIVICSPAAAQSRWLNEEIRYFKSLGRGDRIFCFMVHGRPEIGAPEYAFPPALNDTDETGPAVEHLAADPRVDGKRNAFLKILGGMLGVGIDALKQRDAQRRARVWASVAGISMTIAVAMVGLALYAVATRNEANVRRAQAENLIGFMLGDLRGRLEPIGRLDVLDAVGDEAMLYFEALDRNATPRDLRSRAMALRQIGEVRFNQGHLEQALPAFIESRAILQQLFDADDSADEDLFELGQSEFWVGYVHYERAEYEEAQRAMSNYLDISLSLRGSHPDNQDYLAEVAYAYSNLGSVARGRGDHSAALRYFRESVRVSEQQLELSPDNPGLMADLAGGNSWIGTAEMEVGNLVASEAAFRTALSGFTGLTQRTDNARYLERRASTAALLAGILLMRGNLDEAYERARLGYEEFRTLTARDATNGRWKSGFASSARDMAELAHYMGDPAAADRFLAAAREQFDELMRLDASNTEWQESQLALVELATRIRFDRDPNDPNLEELLHNAREQLIASLDHRRSSVELLGTYALLTHTYASLMTARGKRDEALRAAQDVFERVSVFPDPPFVLQPTLLALAEIVGDRAVAARLGDGVTASGFVYTQFPAN